MLTFCITRVMGERIAREILGVRLDRSEEKAIIPVTRGAKKAGIAPDAGDAALETQESPCRLTMFASSRLHIQAQSS